MTIKVKVDIYGEWDQLLGGEQRPGGCGGCSSKAGGAASGCGGCSSGGGCGSGGCGSKAVKSTGQTFEELVQFIEASDVKEYTELAFIDIGKVNILDYEDARYLYEEGYELPYCIIDGIARYYGGISNALIYKDIKELLEG